MTSAKACYDLENVCVLNCQGLQNLMPLVLAVMNFCACVLFARHPGAPRTCIRDPDDRQLPLFA